ncbi:MAG TPA: hypothetical protein VNO35_20725 [Steroidobacteraceae bacterium]|nr:hypothetical protein [Steroidobacteraceae bacterium]
MPSTNPFYVNPGGGTDPVTIDYNFLDDIGPAFTDVLVNDLNLTLGVNIDVSTAWKVTLYANYAKESENQFAGGQVDQTALAAALADTNPATAFNPFGDGSHTHPITLKTLATGGRFYTDSRLRTADVTADGPIGHLPGGAIKLAFGADHRNQVFDTALPVSPVSPASRAALSRNVAAAFGELTVPLFGKNNGGMGYRRLDLSVAGRYEQGLDFTTNYTRVWAPGALKLSLDGTYLFHFTQQDEPGAPSQQLLDTQNNPLSLKMRGTLS